MSPDAPMGDELRLSLRNDVAELGRLHPEVSRFLGDRVSADAAQAVELALEELVTNVIRHGYDDAGSHRIDVRVALGAGHVLVEVEDDGRAFDPRSAPPARVDAPLEERRPGGLGIHLVRAFAEAVDYERVGRRNRVRVRIACPADGSMSD